jgi:two-component system, LytTR family, sensor kinase
MDLQDLQEESPRFGMSARRWAWIACLWLGFGLLTATQTVVGMRADGMQHLWGRLFFTLLLSCMIWMPMTPLIQWLGCRFPPIHWRPVSTWLVHLLACTAVGVMYAAWAAWLQGMLHPWGSPADRRPLGTVFASIFSNDYLLFVILYAAVLAIDYSLESRKRLAQRETEAARLSEELSKAQLDALRRQLEPHFLFNTLNAVAGLVREDRNDDAVTMIARLSDLLRRVLEGSDRQEVSLGEEMDLLGRYLDIQKMRFSDRLQVEVNVPHELLATKVPSLILQPMIENAIQHGIGRRVEGGAIEIAASRLDGLLTIRVRNDGPSLPANWEQAHRGIGIANVRTRLQSLYGKRCVLDIHNHTAGGVEVLLSFPLRTCPP